VEKKIASRCNSVPAYSIQQLERAMRRCGSALSVSGFGIGVADEPAGPRRATTLSIAFEEVVGLQWLPMCC
jgi:hypothetical protein